MRPSFLIVALLSLSAPSPAQDAPASPGPSAALVKTACSSGLLIRRDDEAKTDKAGSEDTDDSGSFSDLFGGSDDGAKDGEKPKAAKSAPKKAKAKTRLLRPRSDKDKEACPARVKEYYDKHGDQVDAVPAPENVPTEQLEANIDRAFGLAAGPTKKARLSALKDGDLATQSAYVAQLFDGVKTLDAASFETVGKRAHALAEGRADAVLHGDLGAPAAGDVSGPAAVKPPITPAPTARDRDTDDRSADDPRSPEQRQRVSSPPELGQTQGGYQPPPVGTSAPQGPPAQSLYNRWTPNFVQDAARGAGSWLADKVYGGGNPAVNVQMPADTQSPERWRRVRFGNYGTDAMIKGLVAVGEDMGKMHAPTLQLGDISQKGGGTFRRHLSHRVGKDVDVFFITDKSGRFDVPWNLTLAATAVKDMNVTRIFVDTPLQNHMTQYLKAHPEIPADERGYMQKALSRMSYWPGHDTHFHIRIDY
jgi:hypothetical protein